MYIPNKEIVLSSPVITKVAVYLTHNICNDETLGRVKLLPSNPIHCHVRVYTVGTPYNICRHIQIGL